MNPAILITGVTGNVGSEVAKQLNEKKIPFKSAVRKVGGEPIFEYGEQIEFDLMRPETFKQALFGVEKVFLIRPPAIADPRYFEPLLMEAQQQGVKHIVFLSLLGAQTLFFVPHRKIEKRILKAAIPYTFLRPSFFMQNLNTTHMAEIREDRRIYVPAGNGKTSFIDVRDIAAVAVKALTEQGHENKAYDLTGSEALTYLQVAELMSEIWETAIQYANPSAADFKAYWKSHGLPQDQINVMAGIYFTAKIGFAKKVTPDLKRLIGREPITMRQYIQDYREEFQVI